MRTYSEVSHPSPVVPFLLGDDDYVSSCPACGDPIDYCTGHGTIGDPIGARILAQHDEGDHGDCDPRGCDDAAGIA